MIAFNKIIIKYTSLVLPPPHAYSIHVDIINTPTNVKVYFNHKYLEREDFTIEELEEEGLAETENFNWEGHLPLSWKERLEKDINKGSIKSSDISDEEITVIVITDDGDEVVFKNQERWIYNTQELYQACLEAAEKELPLKIRIAHQDEGILTQYLIAYSFKSLECNIKIEGNDSTRHVLTEWANGQKFLKEVFNLEFLPQQVLTKLPPKDGIWIDPGEQNWYSAIDGIRGGKKHQYGLVLYNMVQSLIPSS